MANPLDALHFRQAFGSVLRSEQRGFNQAFRVAPIRNEFDNAQNYEIVDTVRKHMASVLDFGETFYVSSEITSLLVDMADRLDNSIFHFEPDDFPSLTGAVYFDGLVPLPTSLHPDGHQSLRALMWGQFRGSPENGMLLFQAFPGDEVLGKVVYTVADSLPYNRERLGPWTARHWLPMHYGIRYSADLISNEWDADSYFRDTKTEEEREEDRKDTQASVGRIYRLMYVWSHFMKTEITGHRTLDLDRAHRKMAKREGRPLPQVRIVTLRRYASGPFIGPGEEYEWTHRWKVRGHWRQQRVGPGRAFVRPVFVHEFIKGPAHLPLDERDTIQALTR